MRPEESALYAANTPQRFWRLLGEEPAPAEWDSAIEAAAAVLPRAARGADLGSILHATLGEGQFGDGHWRLSRARRLYYRLKPLLPRAAILRARRAHRRQAESGFALGWPSEDRYASFLADVVGWLLARRGARSFDFVNLWPHAHRFAFVLTHDVETAEGQAHALEVAELETRLGFRSSFNLVPERYRVDRGLVRELRDRGFEVGLHDLRHDGRLFDSPAAFHRGAARINRHLADLGAAGFRAALTHRNPLWMQELEIEYDLSFFDTDPYEPMPGGTMSLWPFQLGRFVELPYTLAQDNTLSAVLGEREPALWLDKVAFVARHCGLALLNAHPDYLREPGNRRTYERFLGAMAAREDAWHCLPVEAARWWRSRAEATSPEELLGATVSRVGRDGWPSVAVAPAAGARRAG